MMEHNVLQYLACIIDNQRSFVLNILFLVNLGVKISKKNEILSLFLTGCTRFYSSVLLENANCLLCSDIGTRKCNGGVLY